MAVTELYYIDGYRKECKASVVRKDKSAFVLDRTVFYPEGGGQPGDRGMFSSFHIRDTVKDDDGTIWHVTDGEAPAVGTEGLLVLDWDHRYHYMKEHSAQHLVSALMFSHEHIGTVAVHQGEDSFTIETDVSEIGDDVLFRIEGLANEAIRKNLRIWQDEVAHEEAESLNMRRSIKVSGRVKLVHIADTDVVACGGVHAASTGELLEIAYVAKERIRGHVRTIWKCAEDAVAWRHGNRRIISALSALFSAEPDKLYAAAERQIAETAELKRKAKHAERIAAHALLSAGNGDVPVIFSDIPASSFEDEKERMFLALDSAGRFLFHGSAALFERLKTECNIKGGGRNELFMGSYKDNAEEFMRKAKEILDGREEA